MNKLLPHQLHQGLHFEVHLTSYYLNSHLFFNIMAKVRIINLITRPKIIIIPKAKRLNNLIRIISCISYPFIIRMDFFKGNNRISSSFFTFQFQFVHHINQLIHVQTISSLYESKQNKVQNLIMVLSY